MRIHPNMINRDLILNSDIGTAKDNLRSPLHDWYRFTAGFSYKLVDNIIKTENLKSKDKIFESFAGCGTTLVTAQKHGIAAVGNEGQELLFDVIKAKLNWDINPELIHEFILELSKYIKENNRRKKFDVHDLLTELYEFRDLKQLVLIRDFLEIYKLDEPHTLFLKLALTQTLHKSSVHPIAIPYISRNKTLVKGKSAIVIFCELVDKMLIDVSAFSKMTKTSEIFLHDSRLRNINIEDSSCSVCITSPPYLNNLDYGEVSKVCTHFFGITKSWNDITEKVRKNLVTGSTTHYKESNFSIDKWKESELYLNNKRIGNIILNKSKEIKEALNFRKGKKSFDILTLYYFEDMFKVLQEMNRVLKKGKNAYLVLGDSAPYGVYINTTKYLGEIALNAGFKNFDIVKIRERGTKWKTLKNRHSMTLSEDILILRG